jgi:hypothetical protein
MADIMTIIVTGAAFLLGFLPLYLAVKILGGEITLLRAIFTKLIGTVILAVLTVFLGIYGLIIAAVFMLLVYIFWFDLSFGRAILAWVIELAIVIVAIVGLVVLRVMKSPAAF